MVRRCDARIVRVMTMCGGTTSARCSQAKLPAGRPPPRKRDGTRQAFGASEEVAQPQRASAANVPRAQSESKHEEVHGSGARMRVVRAGPATPLPSIICLPLVERPGWSRREAGPPYHNRVGCSGRRTRGADAESSREIGRQVRCRSSSSCRCWPCGWRQQARRQR